MSTSHSSTYSPTEEVAPHSVMPSPVSFSGRVKNFAVRGAVAASQGFLRHWPLKPGKRSYWERVCVPYLSWRQNDFTAATTFGGRMWARPAEFIENRLLFFGVWEPNVTALFQRILKPGDVALDVGANVGYYAVLSASLVGPKGQVYAVEPSSMIRGRLASNLELNRATNVEVLACAAWDAPGEAEFHVSVDGNIGASSLRDLPAGDIGEVEAVRLARLEDLVAKEHYHRISLIKLDIEGAELRALRGLEAVLDASPRLSIIAEVNPEMLAQMGDSATALVGWLADRGFSPYLIPNSFDADAYFGPIAIARPVPLSDVPPEVSYMLFQRSAASL